MLLVWLIWCGFVMMCLCWWGSVLGMLVGVWLMEFYEWVVLYFGVVYGLLVLFDYVLIGFDGCSVV